MSSSYIWLDKYDFVYKRVMFIPDRNHFFADQTRWVLGYSDWYRIKHTIKGML